MQKTALVIVMLSLVMVGMLVERVHSHGMMLVPVQRSSRWRDPRYPDAPRNYNDNQLFCGGFSTQWNQNNGSCGVCGDAFSAPEPRDNEANGTYAQGVIVETYTQGQAINVTVQITANHLGYFYFKLCPNNNIYKTVTKECLDQHALNAVTADGNLADRVYIGTTIGNISIILQLPVDVTCTQCVLQWTYNTGNSWGCFDNGTCCVGCGPQENFVNCADVEITSTGATTNAATTTTSSATSATSSSSASTTTVTTTTATNPTVSSSSTSTLPPTTPAATTPNTTPTATTPTTPTATTPTATTPTTTTTTTTTTTAGSNQMGPTCQAVPPYDTIPGYHQWCVINCARGYCPAGHCTCS